MSAFAVHVAEMAETYDIPVTPQTILTHAEVQPTLGIKQNGKWDINWLPGMDRPADPIAAGNRLRAMILRQMDLTPPKAPPAVEVPPMGFRAWLSRFIGRNRS